jgi:hypothetical protein
MYTSDVTDDILTFPYSTNIICQLVHEARERSKSSRLEYGSSQYFSRAGYAKKHGNLTWHAQTLCSIYEAVLQPAELHFKFQGTCRIASSGPALR